MEILVQKGQDNHIVWKSILLPTTHLRWSESYGATLYAKPIKEKHKTLVIPYPKKYFRGPLCRVCSTTSKRQWGVDCVFGMVDQPPKWSILSCSRLQMVRNVANCSSKLL